MENINVTFTKDSYGNPITVEEYIYSIKTEVKNSKIMKEENKLQEEKRKENPTISSEFKKELTDLLNRHSRENHSNTPDGILCKYLIDSLEAFDRAVNSRTMWYDSYSDQIKEKTENNKLSLKEELERIAKSQRSEEDK